MLVKAAGYCRRKLLGLLPKLMGKHSERLKVGHTQLFDLQNLYYLIDRSLWLLYWLLVLLFCYQWLGFVLSQFPYTRSWGKPQYPPDGAAQLPDQRYFACHARPGRCTVDLLHRPGHQRFLQTCAKAHGTPRHIEMADRRNLATDHAPDVAGDLAICPGDGLPLSTRLGYRCLQGVVSVARFDGFTGATSVIGQGAAGLILTYTRTLRVGEFVRVGDYEGTVTEVGMFTTTIRTGLGEVLTLPNSMITGSVTKNYSRIVQGPGYVVDTVVTIGYDTPWRQVEAMLLEAARRTDGVLQTPMPQVFQTALSDFYPEYRLVAQAIPSEPRPRAQLLSLLHANIQDVFNEYGVQIMSPHYLGDPEQPKWVPKEQWHAAPSKPENTA